MVRPVTVMSGSAWQLRHPTSGCALDDHAGRRGSSRRRRSSRLAGPTQCWPISTRRRSHITGELLLGQLVTGLGLAESTPGPLVVTEFVG